MRKRIPVSVVVTTLNEGKTIQAFLASINGQSVLPDELVLCDGGSKDDTVTQVRAFTAEFAIHLIEAVGANIARGRNTAIRSARNDVLAISDAGSVLDKHWLEEITKPLLTQDDVSVVGGGYELEWVTSFERIAAAAELSSERQPRKTFLPSSRSFALRKTAWHTVGGYPEELTFAGEDTAFCRALQRAGYRIHRAPSARVTWRPRPNLSSYFKQHMLYGIGDGEARNRDRFYLIVFLKWFCAGLLLFAALWNTWFFLALAAGAILYFMRLSRVYGWNAHPLRIRIAAFGLIFIKEASLFFGWLNGRFRRRVRRG